MADSKITALTSISTSTDPANDPLVIVDVSDTSMAATGTTKKVTLNQLLGASGTATLASATITGAATVGTTLGVTGVSTFAAGTAALPALTTTGDTNTGIFYPAADTFAVTTGGSERYRIDSSGNVGIGVTPSAWSGTKALQIGTASSISDVSGDFHATANAYNTTLGWNYISNAAATDYYQRLGAHVWRTASASTGAITWTQAMTLDASGNLLLGQTASTNGGLLKGYAFNLNSGESQFFIGHQTGTASGTYYEGYSYNGTLIGSITQSGTTGVAFNNTSDYRLKESVKPFVGGLARVNALKPSIYKWKSDGSNGEGFLAHELAEIVPLAVTGDKDAVNEDGSIKPQQVDLSKVVPTLVAAIQELAAEVNALKNA